MEWLRGLWMGERDARQEARDAGCGELRTDPRPLANPSGQ